MAMAAVAVAGVEALPLLSSLAPPSSTATIEEEGYTPAELIRLTVVRLMLLSEAEDGKDEGGSVAMGSCSAFSAAAEQMPSISVTLLVTVDEDTIAG